MAALRGGWGWMAALRGGGGGGHSLHWIVCPPLPSGISSDGGGVHFLLLELMSDIEKAMSAPGCRELAGCCKPPVLRRRSQEGSHLPGQLCWEAQAAGIAVQRRRSTHLGRPKRDLPRTDLLLRHPVFGQPLTLNLFINSQGDENQCAASHPLGRSIHPVPRPQAQCFDMLNVVFLVF